MGEATGGRRHSQGIKLAFSKPLPTKSTTTLELILTTIGEHQLQVLHRTGHPTLAAKLVTEPVSGEVIRQLLRRSL